MADTIPLSRKRRSTTYRKNYEPDSDGSLLPRPENVTVFPLNLILLGTEISRCFLCSLFYWLENKGIDGLKETEKEKGILTDRLKGILKTFFTKLYRKKLLTFFIQDVISQNHEGITTKKVRSGTNFSPILRSLSFHQLPENTLSFHSLKALIIGQ